MSLVRHEYKVTRRSAYSDTEDVYVLSGGTRDEMVKYAEDLIRSDGQKEGRDWAEAYWHRVENLNGELVLIRRHPFTD